MKVQLIQDSKMRIGGGFTFIRNVTTKIPMVEKGGDVLFLASSSTITPETMTSLEQDTRPLVLRIDGYPEDWRNGGKGIRGLQRAYRRADYIIYQSLFSYNFVGKYLEENFGRKQNSLIYNGADKKIFTAKGEQYPMDTSKRNIVVNFYRKDPNKRYEEVMYRFRQLWLDHKNIHLYIIGRIPTEYMNYQGGFFNNEPVTFLGVLKPEDIARVYRTATELWYPSFADPCPNAVIEALNCGLSNIAFTNPFGGVREIIALYKKEPYRFTLHNMCNAYLEVFQKIYNGVNK